MYVTKVLLDLVVLSAAYWLAQKLGPNAEQDAYWQFRVHVGWAVVVLGEIVALRSLPVPSFTWRYVGVSGATSVALPLMSANLMFIIAHLAVAVFRQRTIPLGVLLANTLLAIVGLISARLLFRLFRKRRDPRQVPSLDLTRVLLVGAGNVGMTVARELAARPEHGLQVVGFLDDDKWKIGTRIGGVRVIGTTAQIAEFAERLGATRVLITIANAPASEIRRITLTCRDCGLGVKIVSGFSDVVNGRVSIREIALEDILACPRVEIDEPGVSDLVHKAVVLVTGVGGSVGGELCRQLCAFAPRQVVLVERSDNALSELYNELSSQFRQVSFVPQLADVLDERRMDAVLAQSRPSLIFHTIDYRHVSMLEHFPTEAVKNNIGATHNMAELAHKRRVGRFILVSDQKATNPISVMGATMRVAESMLQTLARHSTTRFICIRLGNLITHAGNVVQIFRSQIARRGPVTVTHPEMARCFMHTPSACKLILQAASLGSSGDVISVDGGTPVKILDLARDLITLSGFQPDSDIQIRFTGVRAGEEIVEEPFDKASSRPTKHPLLWVNSDTQRLSDPKAVDILLSAARSADNDDIRAQLQHLVPGFAQAGLQPTEKHRLFYVGNLPSTVTDTGVRLACKDWGTIHDVQIPRNDAGRSRGFALVKVETPALGTPISSSYGATLAGRELRVDEVRRADEDEVRRVTWQIPPRTRPTRQLQPAPSVSRVESDGAGTGAPLPVSPSLPAASTDELVYLNASFDDGDDRLLVVGVPRTLLLDVGAPRAGSLLSPERGAFPRASRPPRSEKLRFVVSSPLCRVTPATAVYEVGGPPARFELVARRGPKDGNMTVTISVLRDDALVHVASLLLKVSGSQQPQVQP
ncbi:MAG TPA: polysaccharide biosynthesis protein [Kofleriaceae bacterium]